MNDQFNETAKEEVVVLVVDEDYDAAAELVEALNLMI
jgi:hypothetical protein